MKDQNNQFPENGRKLGYRQRRRHSAKRRQSAAEEREEENQGEGRYRDNRHSLTHTSVPEGDATKRREDLNGNSLQYLLPEQQDQDEPEESEASSSDSSARRRAYSRRKKQIPISE